MDKAKVWVEKIVIPTYEIGAAEKNPVFLDKRVYQGSSGKVYPYPVIEQISDKKTDKEYTAVWLENEYIKVMVLPELGGRIQRAYDKTNGYDFVYYNHVIKPALVGLTGPWISGGIEFNWPQHHRPTTFLPVDYEIAENADGSSTVLLHDVDQIYGTKGLMKITLYSGKAYIEITGQLYNRTPYPQTFLWWANPAVPVNDNTQSVFPPDVHAVMDHGKRDVSRFPIATGVYYKKDYSEGVDISRYKNIPVPTSYMAEKSKYDFVGGYDYGVGAGILHVADHHISPGKKQWTWGCGDFGKAWDKNLTDDDGPYVELMTGVYTDNQPDFAWLKPFEEKSFKQYFMPYKAVGQVKNAAKEAAVHLSYDGKLAKVIVYTTSVYDKSNIVLTAAEQTVLNETVRISPIDIYETSIAVSGVKEEQLHLAVYADGKCLVEYQAEVSEIPKLPEPAKTAKAPGEIMTNEELYFTGQHVEQYRHATYLPDPYYLEGLKRDPGDVRINNAYGLLIMRRGCFDDSEKYFRKSLERLTERNPNPYNSEAYYNLGLVLLNQNRTDEAYDAFYKATWSSEQQEMSYFYLSAIDAKRGKYNISYEHIERALLKNSHNIKARGLKAYLLKKLGKTETAKAWIKENLELDPFDFISCNEQVNTGDSDRISLNKKMRDFAENYLMTARDYAEFGAYDEAITILGECTQNNPMLYYYKAYYAQLQGMTDKAKKYLAYAEQLSPDYCFPNKLEDIAVLRFAITNNFKARACYYLGILFYDKLQWEQSIELWEESAKIDPTFPTVWRNLSLAYYNKAKNVEKAKTAMEQAFSLNTNDVRVFLELDQLYKKIGIGFEERLTNYEVYKELIDARDDLYIEYITLLNMTGQHEKAYECVMSHRFHPWEGGEGKVTTQYTLAILMIAKKALAEGKYKYAENFLTSALKYPDNLGEGKLEGTKDNHIYYYLGLSCELQGKSDEAEKYYERATIGTNEPAGAMYYNDQPADMILYQGLAYLKLGKLREAHSRFYRLIDYGEQHLRDNVKIDYFAVSLPDFLIFDEDYSLKNCAHCYYLMALGNIGINDSEKAKEFLKKAAETEPSHMMSRVYTLQLQSKLYSTGGII